MLSHISRENASNDPLSDSFKLIGGHLFEEVVFLHYEESFSGMKIFLHRDIAISDCLVGHGIYVIPIGVPIVAQVMTDPCQQKSQNIYFLEV